MTRTDGAAQRPIVKVAHDLDIAEEFLDPYGRDKAAAAAAEVQGALHRDHAGELSVVNVNAVLNSFPAPPALAMRPRRSCLGDSGS